MLATFILATTPSMAVVGYVQNTSAAQELAGENLIVSQSTDLEALSNQQLTDLFNQLSGTEHSLFKTAKSESATKVFALLEAVDISTLVRLDQAEEGKVAAQAEVVAAGPKVRKVRNSKLQRMKAAFLTQETDGSYKRWTVKELMEFCSTPEAKMSERIAKVYISILRSSKDRFVMPITLDKESKQYWYEPSTQAQA